MFVPKCIIKNELYNILRKILEGSEVAPRLKLWQLAPHRLEENLRFVFA